MHFERRMPFKMYKIKFFPEEKYIKKYVCLPYLEFLDPLSETHLFFYLALFIIVRRNFGSRPMIYCHSQCDYVTCQYTSVVTYLLHEDKRLIT